jgi:hypothetical protein
MLAIYLHQLPLNVRFMQVEHPYVWERHATLKAFWRLLLQGRGAGEASVWVTALSGVMAIGLAIGLLVVIHKWLRAQHSRAAETRYPIPDTRYLSLDRLIAATIAVMPLLMPFYFDYDLMLLAIPAVLLAGEKIRHLQQIETHLIPHDAATDILRVTFPADRRLVRIWAAMFLWMEVNPGIASRTHVNLTIPLLTMVAALLIRRALRRQAKDETGDGFGGTLTRRQAA